MTNDLTAIRARWAYADESTPPDVPGVRVTFNEWRSLSASRSDIPALCDEVEALRKRVGELEATGKAVLYWAYPALTVLEANTTTNYVRFRLVLDRLEKLTKEAT